jgi:hypothetical protein
MATAQPISPSAGPGFAGLTVFSTALFCALPRSFARRFATFKGPCSSASSRAVVPRPPRRGQRRRLTQAAVSALAATSMRLLAFVDAHQSSTPRVRPDQAAAPTRSSGPLDVAPRSLCVLRAWLEDSSRARYRAELRSRAQGSRASPRSVAGSAAGHLAREPGRAAGEAEGGARAHRRSSRRTTPPRSSSRPISMASLESPGVVEAPERVLAGGALVLHDRAVRRGAVWRRTPRRRAVRARSRVALSHDRRTVRVLGKGAAKERIVPRSAARPWRRSPPGSRRSREAPTTTFCVSSIRARCSSRRAVVGSTPVRSSSTHYAGTGSSARAMQHPRALRHVTCATHLLDSGADLRTIQGCSGTPRSLHDAAGTPPRLDRAPP